MTIYLDCNATTPIDPEVAKVVRHYMEVEFGNAGSRTHEYGLRAKQAVERAREQVAAVVNAKPDEVIFTSGATEANNLAILGLEAEGRRTGKMHIVSTQIEHKAVLEPLEEMRRRGFEVTLVPPNRGGWVEPHEIARVVREDTLLASVMHVNNETGVIQPVPAIAEALSSSGVLLHVDAAQGFAKISGLETPRIDMISVSGHKLFAPKGVGALVVRRRGWSRVPLLPLMYGGGQERGLRPGTLPVPLVAGLGIAAESASRDLVSRAAANRSVREVITGALTGAFCFVGDQERVAPWTLSLYAPGVDSEMALVHLKKVAALSNGSACSSHLYGLSHVTKAMGMTEAQASCVIRLSWHHRVNPSDRALRELVGAMLVLTRRGAGFNGSAG